MNLAIGYAQALYDLQKEQHLSSDVAVSKLMKLLSVKGHTRLLKQIALEFEKLHMRVREKETLTMRCARKEDFEKFRNVLSEHFSHSSAEFTKEVLDDTLIGGFVLQKGETIVDGSYKRKLLLLYQSTTT